MDKLFIFGAKILVHRREERFYLAEGAKETIEFLRRHGDDVALAVLGDAREQVRKVAFLEDHGIHFKTVLISQDDETLGSYMRSAIHLHGAKNSFCVHRDAVILRMARRAGARSIYVGDAFNAAAGVIGSLPDLVALYPRL